MLATLSVQIVESWNGSYISEQNWMFWGDVQQMEKICIDGANFTSSVAMNPLDYFSLVYNKEFHCWFISLYIWWTQMTVSPSSNS